MMKMLNGIKRALAGNPSGEKGQSLLIVIVFLLIGSLTLPPLLAYMSTSLRGDEVYDGKSDSLYAADAGIEDGVWQIKYGGLEALAGHENYNYDFTSNWTYELGEPVNGVTTNVTVQNVWIPSNVTLSGLGLTAAEAKDIIERDISDNATNRLMVTGTPLDEDDYRIKIDFYPSETETSALQVDSVGVWLPQGFGYDGSCNLATFPDSSGEYTESEEERPGGEAVVWDFSASSFLFTDLPPETLYPTSNPQTAEITFKYTSEDSTVRPAAVAWIVTSGNLSTDIPIAWDIDTRYYKVSSAASGTSIDAYASRSEMRSLYAAISGDYAAIGNSQMTDTNSDNIRDYLHYSTSYDLDTISDNATVTHAYLYWSGFYKSGFSTPSYWGADTCNDFDEWTNTTPDTVWRISSGRFRGHYTGSDSDARYLTMADCVNLSACPAGTTILEWEQDESGGLEPGDILKFQVSSDNGTNWSDYITAFSDDNPDEYYYYVIPEDYLTSEFRVRFYLDGFSGSNEYCYLDDIAIAEITGSPDSSVDFTVSGNTTDTFTISALQSQVLGTRDKGRYFYSCWQDVTDEVKANCEVGSGDNPTGNADYTIANLDADEGDSSGGPYHLAYAGWSLIIIYYSPQTAGRQLYLWNTFSYNSGNDVNLDFDGDGEPGGLITGFVVPEQVEGEEVAARLTCFVGEGDAAWYPDTLAFNGTYLWDGTSTNGNSKASPQNVWNGTSVNMQNGIDVDTFTIYWNDGLLFADDTEAQIDMFSGQDNYVLIYMILSVVSETTVSGTTHYMING
jgi:hypothetical protein